jgi:C1A family cysteine protease
MTTTRYTVARDKVDPRDYMFAPKTVPAQLPSTVDLRSNMPPVVDQGQLGSCTANAIAGAFQFDQMKEKINVFAPSRLFIYYNERVLENTVSIDSGAFIRDGIKTINSYGVCKESTWPYNINSFTVTPPTAAYNEAKGHIALAYYRVNVSVNDIKTALASGFPVVVGISVYASFETMSVARTGVVPMPATRDQYLGGHCVLLVGYDNAKQRFIARNSWGTSWGDKGYFYLPYTYATPSLMADCWVVSSVS